MSTAGTAPNESSPRSQETGPSRARVGEWAALVIILIFASLVSGRGFTEPWNDRHHGANGARYSLIARNYLAHDWLGCRLEPRMDTVTADVPMFTPYLRHPFLVPLFISFSFAVFGEHEWAARLVALLAHLGVIAMLWRLVRRFATPAAALATAALYAALPMSAYYGGMVDPQGAMVLVFSLLGIDAYSRWSETGRLGTACRAGAWLSLAAMSDWPGFYVAGFLPVWEWMARGRSARRSVLWFPVGAVVLGLGFLAYVEWVTGDFRGIFGKAVRTRSLWSFVEDSDQLRLFVSGILGRWRPYFPIGFLLLAIVGSVEAFRQRFLLGRLFGLIVLSSAVGIVHIVLFPQGAWVHPYWAYLLAPPVALAGGIAVELVMNRLEQPASSVWIALIVVLCGWSGVSVWQRLGDERTTIAYEFADRLRSGTPPEALLLTLERVPNFGSTVLYYIRRRVVGPIETPEQLHDQLVEANRPSHFFARHETLVAPENAELVRALAGIARPAPPLGRGAWKVFRLE